MRARAPSAPLVSSSASLSREALLSSSRPTVELFRFFDALLYFIIVGRISRSILHSVDCNISHVQSQVSTFLHCVILTSIPGGERQRLPKRSVLSTVCCCSNVMVCSKYFAFPPQCKISTMSLSICTFPQENLERENAMLSSKPPCDLVASHSSPETTRTQKKIRSSTVTKSSVNTWVLCC